MWLFKYLNDAGLLTNNIISMNKFDLIQTHFEGRVFTENEYVNIKDLTPIEPYEHPNEHNATNFATTHGGDYISLINKQIMLDSWLTVVSEASFGDNEGTCFISEKTFKPIACYHPFIIFGNKGSLEHLRQMGYRTFSPYIDETYNIIKDPLERLQAVVAEMKRISNLPPTLQLKLLAQLNHIADFNKQRFFSQEFFQQILQEYKTNLSVALTQAAEHNSARYFNSNRLIFKSLCSPEEYVKTIHHVENNTKNLTGLLTFDSSS
jgi:hypothetical protein